MQRSVTKKKYQTQLYGCFATESYSFNSLHQKKHFASASHHAILNVLSCLWELNERLTLCIENTHAANVFLNPVSLPSGLHV